MRSAATMSSWALLIVAGSLPAGHARADDLPVPPITNMCTGVLAPEATFSIVVKQPNGSFLAIDRNLTGSVISGADCACDVQDLFLQAFVSKGLPNGTQPTFSVWEGSACNEVQPRTTTCEQVAATVAPSDFWSGSSNTNPQQQIHVPALLTPDPNASPGNPTAHTCPQTAITNSVWLLFGPLSKPDFCVVVVPASTIPPTPAQDVSAVSGDGGVTVKWRSPPVGSAFIPVRYQVLCADENGQPLPGQGAFSLGEPTDNGFLLGYSTCLDPATHTIERRVIGNNGTTNGDKPVVFPAVPPPAPHPIDPNGPLDPQVIFNHLEKQYVCSNILTADGTDHSLRIDNLDNGRRFFFTVVAIDAQGNPAPSPVVTEQAKAVEDLYRRFRDQGGEAQGFCFIATAAWGSYESPYVKVLRDFRDQALLPHAAGRAFVDWYYLNSPPAAAYIAERPVARWLVRQALWPVIGAALLWLWMPSWLAWTALVGVGGLGARRMGRRPVGLWRRWRGQPQ